jgi:hypothetical protein
MSPTTAARLGARFRSSVSCERVRAEEEGSRFGRPSLGYAPRAATSRRFAAGLDVRDPNACGDRGGCSPERRVRVPADECPVRALAVEGIADTLRDELKHFVALAGAGGEPVGGLRKSQLLEEQLPELAIVVLPRMQHYLVDPARAERLG